MTGDKQETKARRMLFTLATTGVATIVLFGINLFLTPFITEKLGVEAYGFISLANTFVSYAMIVMTALNSFATRYIAVEYHQGNIVAASGFFSSLFYANVFLSLCVFIGAIPVVVFPSLFLNVPINMSYEVTLLFLFVFCNFLISNGSASFSSAAYIKNRLDVYGIFQTIAYVAEAGILLLTYSALPPSLWYYGIALIAAGVAMFSGNLFIYRKYAPELKISRELFSFDKVKELMSVGVWSSINSLGNVLNNGLGLLVSNIMLGAVAMGELAIARTFIAGYSRLYQLISQAFYPLILKSYSADETAELVVYLKAAMALTGSVASVLFAGFCVFCPTFYSVWIPDQDTSKLYLLTIIVMAYSFIEGPVQPLYYIYAITLKNRIPTIITVIGGLVNIAAMIPLILFTDLGVFAVPFASVIVFLIICFVTNPIYSAHCLGLRRTAFYPQIARTILACGCCCVVFKIVELLFAPSGWWGLLVSAMVCCLLGSLVCLFTCFDARSRRWLSGKLRRTRGRLYQ